MKLMFGRPFNQELKLDPSLKAYSQNFKEFSILGHDGTHLAHYLNTMKEFNKLQILSITITLSNCKEPYLQHLANLSHLKSVKQLMLKIIINIPDISKEGTLA